MGSAKVDPAPSPEIGLTPIAADGGSGGGAEGHTSRRTRPAGRRPWTITAVVVIAGLLLLAGVVYWQANSGGPGSPSGPPGWLTFRGADALAQAFVDEQTGGPWEINFAAGVAADGAFAPMVGGSQGASTRCAQALSGVSLYTYWNYSLYPRSSAPTVFSSGTAPLWTFGFLGPAGATAVVSVLNGTTIWNGEFPSTSNCVTGNLSRWPANLSPSSLVDSPQVAAAEAPLMEGGGGLSALPNLWLDPSKDGPTYEVYALGWGSSPVASSDYSTGGPGFQPLWFASWGSCGVPGAPPRGPEITVSFNSSTAAWGHSSLGGMTSCRSEEQLGRFGPVTNGTLPNATARTARWNLTIDPAVTSWVPPPANWSVLPLSGVSVMMALNDGTHPFAPGATTCGVGTARVDQCTVSPGGWFVVLSDSSGHWLDSYPTTDNGTSWSVPGIVPVTGDSLELIVPMEHPSGWTLTLVGVQGSILGSANVYA